MQNRDLFIRTYGKLSENNAKLSILTSDHTRHNLKKKSNIVAHALPTKQAFKQNKCFMASSFHSFNREKQKVNDHDRESSRILVKNIANLMRKYKKCTCRIKLLIKHTCLQYCKPPNCAKNNRISKCCKQAAAQSRTTKPNLRSKRSKLLLAPKCIIQRLETSYKYSLFLCGNIELNPGPVMNTSMSVLTARLARLGLMPINVTGDGNCFFRSVSYQLYQTEDRHAQIRALAIQHLINCPEYFIESNTQQSWVQYLQDMSMQGTWADHIIIQAV